MDDLRLVYLSPHDLTPYENNTRKHSPADIEQIKKSIETDGFNDPIGVWGDENIIVEGHGRQIAAIEMGLERVPCIRLDRLTDTQRRDYAIRHNRTAELSAFDFQKLEEELARLEIEGMDMSGLFDDMETKNNDSADWFSREEKDGTRREDGNEEYNEFLDKFEAKKTTDDCYTPDNVYDAVADWVSQEYNVPRDAFVRPFFPGGDFEHHKYPKNCTVVDNPPFSILAKIIEFYTERGIRFFLFAPGLTALYYAMRETVCGIFVGCGITYENGASVNTGFVTNLERGICARTAPKLYEAVEAANEENEKAMHVQVPKYEYPDEVITSAKLNWLSKYGQDFRVKREDSMAIRKLDAMHDAGIYGYGLLLSERAAAERAAAERAAATKWQLSDREKDLVQSLGNKKPIDA